VAGQLRYLRLIAARTRAPLPAIAAVIFALVGIFSGPRNEVGSTWALTAVVGAGLSAWLAGAILLGEPQAQADMATAAVGGGRGRARLELLLACALAVGIGAASVLYPLALQLAGREVFAPRPGDADVAAAFLAQLGCCFLGASIGALFAPPRVRGRANAAAATLAATVVIVGLVSTLGPLGGPVEVARQLSDTRHPLLDGRELLASAGCIAWAAACLGLGWRWAQRVA
jgi:hypothetical protein